MIDFAWDDFADGKFSVRCQTENLSIDFLEKVSQTEINCNELGFPMWELFKEDTCYFVNYNNKLDSCHTDYCNYNKIPIAEWKI